MPDEMREEDKLPGVAPEVAGPPAGLGESLPPPAPSPWGSRDLGLFVALFVFAAIVFPVLAVAVYAALRPFMGWRLRAEDLTTNPFFLVSIQSVSYVLVVGYIYTLVVLSYRLPFWAGLKWRRPTARQVLQYALGGMLLGVLIAHAPPLTVWAIHGDLHPANVLTRDGRIAGIIDWHYARRDWPAFELACVAWDVSRRPNTIVLDDVVMERAVTDYIAAGGPGEPEHLRTLMRLRALAALLFSLTRAARGLSSNPAFINMLLPALDAFA